MLEEPGHSVYRRKGEKWLHGRLWDQVNQFLVRWANQQSKATIHHSCHLWSVLGAAAGLETYSENLSACQPASTQESLLGDMTQLRQKVMSVWHKSDVETTVEIATRG